MLHRYHGKHAVARAIRALRVRARIGIVSGLIAGTAAPLGLALGGVASADSYHSVHFSASGTGASAGCGAGSQIQLTVGLPSGTTNALAQLTSGSGKALPLTEPVFTTDNYNACSPRFYITLSNGDSLEGYPANAGLNGTDMAWAVNNGNTYQPWSRSRRKRPGRPSTAST